MSNKGRKEGTRAQDVPSICCRHNKMLASFFWAKGEYSGSSAEGIIYQMMYMKLMQKSVRRRKTEWKEGKEEQRGRVISLFLGSGSSFVVSIGRLPRFALPRGGDDFLG